MKSLSSSDQLIQSLIRTQFQQNINIFIILKEMLESNYICIMEGPMNLNLTHKFLLGSTLGQRGLSNDLCSTDSFIIKICEFITFSEPSFSEEPASLIFLNIDVSIVLDYFFLNDDILLVDWLF